RAVSERAAGLLGASVRHGGFVEAPHRSPLYSTLSGLLCQRAGGDEVVLANVRSFLRGLVEELDPQRVLLPLGVDQHIDHRITHEAAAGIAPEYPDVEFLCYEDRPIAFVEEAVWLRLDQLGRRGNASCFGSTSTASRAERFFLSFMGFPAIRRSIRALDHSSIVIHFLEAFVRSLQEPRRPIHPSFHSWSPDILKDLYPALDAHFAESRGFLESPLYHQWAALEYARRIGFAGCYAERFWRL
ncbi:MAG: hypothetical protein U1E22_06120, partial [Coriobacteriia bacterium]|nr:hypothetical protein [Coriobacteriia bacterium]